MSLTANDYGFGLLSREPVPLALGDLGRLLAAPNVEATSWPAERAELGRRQVREIARVAGLTFQGYPGQPHPARQLQASAALLYDVFAEYDPDNLLLAQAVREVLERRLEAPRLTAALARLRGSRALLTRPARPTPFAFPLLVEIFRDTLSTEALEARSPAWSASRGGGRRNRHPRADAGITAPDGGRLRYDRISTTHEERRAWLPTPSTSSADRARHRRLSRLGFAIAQGLAQAGATVAPTAAGRRFGEAAKN
jgi:hypothetical protein